MSNDVVEHLRALLDQRSYETGLYARRMTEAQNARLRPLLSPDNAKDVRVLVFLRLLNVFRKYPDDTAGLLNHYDAVISLLQTPLGAGDVRDFQYPPIPNPYSLVDAMTFVAGFVEHEVHGGGAPHILWLAYPPKGQEAIPVHRGIPSAEPLIVNLCFQEVVGKEPITRTDEGSLLIQVALRHTGGRRDPPSPPQEFFRSLALVLRELMADSACKSDHIL